MLGEVFGGVIVMARESGQNESAQTEKDAGKDECGVDDGRRCRNGQVDPSASSTCDVSIDGREW